MSFSRASVQISIESHSLLEAVAVGLTYPNPLGALESPVWLLELLKPDAAAPLARSDEVRRAVRDLLRTKLYKPTGRGKPASEYLVRAAEDGSLSSINAAVDSLNAVSLHSGLPMSIVDLEHAASPFRIAIALPGESYVFNNSGQVIDLSGLLCLGDAEGFCANAVKDAQRTKTRDTTTSTLTIIWGTSGLGGRACKALDWFVDLNRRLGATESPQVEVVT